MMLKANTAIRFASSKSPAYQLSHATTGPREPLTLAASPSSVWRNGISNPTPSPSAREATMLRMVNTGITQVRYLRKPRSVLSVFKSMRPLTLSADLVPRQPAP